MVTELKQNSTSAHALEPQDPPAMSRPARIWIAVIFLLEALLAFAPIAVLGPAIG